MHGYKKPCKAFYYMTNKTPSPFLVKDCALATLATGIKARSLLQLRDKLVAIPISSIYLHFWGGRLRTTFEHRVYHNDFSFFAHHSLQDDILAERLELLNPHEFPNMEDLRLAILEILDDRIDESESFSITTEEREFYFMSSKIIIFNTQYQFLDPKELVVILPKLTRSSIFYHFIDSARRLVSHGDDFSTWLAEFGEEHLSLITSLKKIDPYFISLTDLHHKIINVVTEYFTSKGKR